jgi:ATP-dependent DNA ligase
MPRLPDSIRCSEALKASSAELTEALREQGVEGIVAKRRDGLYEPVRAREAGRECASSNGAIS